MKKLSQLVILFLLPYCALTQEKESTVKKNNAQNDIHIVHYPDPLYMELHPNRKIYRFKKGIEDGKYIAYYDKKCKQDTAMIVVVKDGLVDGLYQRWDDESLYLSEECEYSKGKMNGIRKLYFKTPEGETLVNIERWKDGVHQEDIQVKW